MKESRHCYDSVTCRGRKEAYWAKYRVHGATRGDIPTNDERKSNSTTSRVAELRGSVRMRLVTSSSQTHMVPGAGNAPIPQHASAKQWSLSRERKYKHLNFHQCSMPRQLKPGRESEFKLWGSPFACFGGQVHQWLIVV
jgi:hypothetical protein